MTGSNRIYGGIYGQVVQVTGRRVSIALTAWCVHNERTATSRWSCVIRLMNSPVTAAAASRHDQTTAFSYPTIFMCHSRESRQRPTLSPIQSLLYADPNTTFGCACGCKLTPDALTQAFPVFLQSLRLWVTRSSAIAEGPRDASCQLKSCQLPRNSAETTCRSYDKS